jgi:hypothetical protein
MPRPLTQWTSRRIGTVAGEVLELGPHLEQFQPHVGVDLERIGPPVPDLDRLVHDRVGFGGLLGDRVDGLFEDVTLSVFHETSYAGGRTCLAPHRVARSVFVRGLI